MIIILQNDKLHHELANQLFDRYYGEPLYWKIMSDCISKPLANLSRDEMKTLKDLLKDNRKIQLLRPERDNIYQVYSFNQKEILDIRKKLKEINSDATKNLLEKINFDKDAITKAVKAVEELKKRKVKHYQRGSMANLLQPTDFDDNERITFIGHGSCKRYGSQGHMESDVDDEQNGMSPNSFSTKLIDEIKLMNICSKIHSIELIGCNIGLSKNATPSYVQEFVNNLYTNMIVINGFLPPKMPKIMAFVNGTEVLHTMITSCNMKITKDNSKFKGRMTVTGYKNKEERALVVQCENDIKECRKQIEEIKDENTQNNLAREEANNKLRNLQKKLSELKAQYCVQLKDSKLKTIHINPRHYFDEAGIVKPQFDVIKHKLRGNNENINKLEEYNKENMVQHTNESIRYQFAPIILQVQSSKYKVDNSETIAITQPIHEDISISENTQHTVQPMTQYDEHSSPKTTPISTFTPVQKHFVHHDDSELSQKAWDYVDSSLDNIEETKLGNSFLDLQHALLIAPKLQNIVESHNLCQSIVTQFNQIAKIAVALEDIHLAFWASFYCGVTYAHLNKIEDAKECCIRSFEFLKASNFPQMDTTNYIKLSDYFISLAVNAPFNKDEKVKLLDYAEMTLQQSIIILLNSDKSDNRKQKDLDILKVEFELLQIKYTEFGGVGGKESCIKSILQIDKKLSEMSYIKCVIHRHHFN